MKISQTKIISASSVTLQLAREKVDKLSFLGIDDKYLDLFEEKIKEAKAISANLQQIIQLKSITNGKNTAKENCFKWARELSIRLKLALNDDEKYSRLFPSKDLIKARHSDIKMISLMKMLISISEENNSLLSKQGQTPEIIEKGKGFHNSLIDNKLEQDSKKTEKKDITVIRQEKFKELYDIINKINLAGRNIFADKPESLVLFETPWPKYKKKNIKINEVPEETDELSN